MADPEENKTEDKKEGEGEATPVVEPKIELPPPIPPPKVTLSHELLAQSVSQIGKSFDGLSYAYTKLTADVCIMNIQLIGERNRRNRRKHKSIQKFKRCVFSNEPAKIFKQVYDIPF